MELQKAYLIERDGEEVIVPREKLTLNERRLNIERLRRESQASKLHADALVAETDDLIRQGKLKALADAE